MRPSTRREVLRSSAAALGGWLLLGGQPARAQSGALVGAQPGTSGDDPGGPYELPPLPYSHADLEPFISAEVLKLHHSTHHAGYVRAANQAIAALERVRREGGEEIRQVRALSDALAFHASGHVLHCLLWTSMKKRGGGDPPKNSDIAQLITRDFGTIEAWRAQFAAAAQQVQGSGWAVLALEPLSRRLLVLQAEKHQNLTVWGCVPLLVVDVWEHAYYLQYQNRRSDYLKAFMNVIDWDSAEARLAQARRLIAGD
jgi:Fe-Mn family superoxide dismutase